SPVSFSRHRYTVLNPPFPIKATGEKSCRLRIRFRSKAEPEETGIVNTPFLFPEESIRLSRKPNGGSGGKAGIARSATRASFLPVSKARLRRASIAKFGFLDTQPGGLDAPTSIAEGGC